MDICSAARRRIRTEEKPSPSRRGERRALFLLDGALEPRPSRRRQTAAVASGGRRVRGSIMPLAVELRSITKRFGAIVANERVNLAVERGKVHAIIGENGAGKTTS